MVGSNLSAPGAKKKGMEMLSSFTFCGFNLSCRKEAFLVLIPYSAPRTARNSRDIIGGYLRELSLSEFDVAYGRTYRGEYWAYFYCAWCAVLASGINALGHRFSPTRDLRREALVKRSATMPLFYHPMKVIRG